MKDLAKPLIIEATQLRPSLEDVIEKCDSLGMRLSRQRRAILELLWDTSEHISARAIYDELNRKGLQIGHTSVYQNLEALSEQGIIECIELSDGRLYGRPDITDRKISSLHAEIEHLRLETSQELTTLATIVESL